MSWEISLISKNISYQFQDKEFQTQQIFHEGRKIIEEKSGGYKETDDTVMIDIYKANSDHGFFMWSVSARRSGFESQAYIDDDEINEISVPENCTCLEKPKFKIDQ